ncbi:MAG: peptidoglycan DD-metalloendopeptidase family protein, partial [Clostridia bacterium]|nr:peptidoglycan DD-metalloendopeptidase family protein [Clostridia bacterium]
LTQVEATWVAEYTKQKELENQINAELEQYLWELAEKQRKLEEQQKLEAQKYQASSQGWPLEAGVSWYVSSPFGWRNLYGVQDYHLGIDLACANGTDVLAFNSGTVLKSEYHWSYGNYVLIDHGSGIATLYAHMSDRWVSAGDTVASGQQIGNVGLTGTTFGYHLHFEVRENGSVTDPAPYLGIY